MFYNCMYIYNSCQSFKIFEKKKIKHQKKKKNFHNLNPTINISILADKRITFYFTVT